MPAGCSAGAPVTFAHQPIRRAGFNDRPYRGQIRVFRNPRGALTVVNVLGLEDYVKGVVPNELSPGGFPPAAQSTGDCRRTYALRNLGQFMSQGFDILPTTRSQVTKGLSSRACTFVSAVDETRGVVATFDGKNQSTCCTHRLAATLKTRNTFSLMLLAIWLLLNAQPKVGQCKRCLPSPAWNPPT